MSMTGLDAEPWYSEALEGFEEKLHGKSHSIVASIFQNDLRTKVSGPWV